MPQTRVILASSSPFRRELLLRLGIPFDAVSPDIDESPRPGERARELVLRLSLEKALAVADSAADALVIGSDQVAVHEGDVIVGKPADREHAIKQLSSASGKTITLYTGLALVNSANGRIQRDMVPYAVKFKTLTAREIESYLDKEQPYGCSGSLRADGLGIALLEKFIGDDPTALIGLPLIRLVAMLEAEGVSPV